VPDSAPEEFYLLYARTLLMKPEELLDQLVKESPPVGKWPLQELIDVTRSKGTYGIAVAQPGDVTWYLFFAGGEPEGAMMIDERGSLFGDKAIYLLKGTESFALHILDPPVVERFILGCRIYDTSHLIRTKSFNVPQFGKKAEGIGKLILAIKKSGHVQPGVLVTMRKGRQVVASDITNPEGKVSFRLLYGPYECILSQKNFRIELFEFRFHKDNNEKVIELDIDSPCQ
jgi:hypothetical protein